MEVPETRDQEFARAVDSFDDIKIRFRTLDRSDLVAVKNDSLVRSYAVNRIDSGDICDRRPGWCRLAPRYQGNQHSTYEE